MKTYLRLFLVSLISLYSVLPVFGSDTIVADTERFRPFKRPYIMSLTIGKQFHTGGTPDAGLFGRRKSVNTEVSFRMAGFFNGFIGAYGELNISGSPWKEEWQPVPGIDLYEQDFFCGIPVSMSLTFGAVCRYELLRWQFFGRLGIGIRNMALDDKRSYNDIYDENGHFVDYDMVYFRAQRTVFPFIVEGGVTIGYRTSKIASIIMDINYRHRIGVADEVVLSRIISAGDGLPPSDEIVLDRLSAKTHSFGNELVVLFGIQLQCDLSGPKKQGIKKAP